MSRNCDYGYRVKRQNNRARIIGIALMVIGVILILVFVPYWVWTSVLAVLFISVGFLIWRFLG